MMVAAEKEVGTNPERCSTDVGRAPTRQPSARSISTSCTEKEEQEYISSLEEFQVTSAEEPPLSRSPMRTACTSNALFPPSQILQSSSQDSVDVAAVPPQKRLESAIFVPRHIPNSRGTYNSESANNAIKASEQGGGSVAADRCCPSEPGSSTTGEVFQQEITPSERDCSSLNPDRSSCTETDVVSPPRIRGAQVEHGSFFYELDIADDDDSDSLIGDYALPGRVRESNAEVTLVSVDLDPPPQNSRLYDVLPVLSSAYDEIFSRFGLTPDKNKAFGQSTHMRPPMDDSPGRTSLAGTDSIQGSAFEEEPDLKSRRPPRDRKSHEQNSMSSQTLAWGDSEDTSQYECKSFLSTKIFGILRLDFLMVGLFLVLAVAMLAIIIATSVDN